MLPGPLAEWLEGEGTLLTSLWVSFWALASCPSTVGSPTTLHIFQDAMQCPHHGWSAVPGRRVSSRACQMQPHPQQPTSSPHDSFISQKPTVPLPGIKTLLEMQRFSSNLSYIIAGLGEKETAPIKKPPWSAARLSQGRCLLQRRPPVSSTPPRTPRLSRAVSLINANWP